MLANELRLGNWVRYNKTGECGQVVAITKTNVIIEVPIGNDFKEIQDSLDDFEPLPLTVDFLLKNGFKKQENHKGVYATMWINDYDSWYLTSSYRTEADDYAGIFLAKEVNDYEEYAPLMECEYVHQLQNVLRDYNIEQVLDIAQSNGKRANELNDAMKTINTIIEDSVKHGEDNTIGLIKNVLKSVEKHL